MLAEAHSVLCLGLIPATAPGPASRLKT
jgi:hypothetical protein